MNRGHFHLECDQNHPWCRCVRKRYKTKLQSNNSLERTLLDLQIDKIGKICNFRHDKKLKLESFLKMSTRTSVIIQTLYSVEVKLVPLPQLNWFLILKRSCLGVLYPVWVYDSLYDRPEKLKFLPDNPTKAEKQHMSNHRSPDQKQWGR